eukprot:TRINITY_DN10697_c0_g1_i2.p1 TRINITY_DN10697_c0_g1~~TRINITY_DN10697_c0_g1_i2.p1  ORF type:complete len:292 (-),score=51.67 TRINITY_DN10697_c0_g1_i2:78-953(-)
MQQPFFSQQYLQIPHQYPLRQGAPNMQQQSQQQSNYNKADNFSIQQICKIKDIGVIPQKPFEKKCRKMDPLIGLPTASYMSKFEQGQPPKHAPIESKKQIIKRVKKQKYKQHQDHLKKKLQEWNPFQDLTVSSDPYKTLFISNLSYQTTEKKLKQEFEVYGPIKFVRIIKDKVSTSNQNSTQKHNGYGFIEYEHKKDFVKAYKQTMNLKLDGRRLLVDFERGRSILNFKPMRLGKGLGGKSRVSISRSSSSSTCLLYTSDAADDMQCVDLGGRRIIKKKKKEIGEQRIIIE